MDKFADTPVGGIPRRAFDNPRAMASLESSNLSAQPSPSGRSVTLGNTNIGGALDTQRRTRQLLEVGSGRNALEVPNLTGGNDGFTDAAGAAKVLTRLRTIESQISSYVRRNRVEPQLARSLNSRLAQVRQSADDVSRQLRSGGTATTRGAYAIPRVVADYDSVPTFTNASDIAGTTTQGLI